MESPSHGSALPEVRRYLERSPVASAVVAGPAHQLVFMNAAFRGMSAGADASASIGEEIGQAIPAAARSQLRTLLDGVRGDGAMVHDVRLAMTADGAARGESAPWLCDAWPVIEDGVPADCLVVALRTARRRGHSTRQRAITERCCCRHCGNRSWPSARTRRGRAPSGWPTRAAVRHVPGAGDGARCRRDSRTAPGRRLVHRRRGPAGRVRRRLAIMHADPAKDALARSLAGHWTPITGDPIGAPLVAESRTSMIVYGETEAVLAAAAHDL